MFFWLKLYVLKNCYIKKIHIYEIFRWKYYIFNMLWLIRIRATLSNSIFKLKVTQQYLPLGLQVNLSLHTFQNSYKLSIYVLPLLLNVVCQWFSDTDRCSLIYNQNLGPKKFGRAEVLCSNTGYTAQWLALDISKM